MTAQGKILVLDDLSINIRLFEKILGSDYEVQSALCGKEALEIANTFIPDIILLDIMMPGMDGYEVCRRLRKNHLLRHSRIIMVSAKNKSAERLLAYDAGADDFISKPINGAEIKAKVKVYMQQLLSRHGRQTKLPLKVKPLSWLLLCALLFTTVWFYL